MSSDLVDGHAEETTSDALTPMPRARRGQGIGADLASRVRGDQALRLRIAGLPWSEVARECGYSNRSGARRAALRAAARADLSDKDRQEWRTVQLARYEQLIRAVWPAAVEGDIRAIATARSVLDSESRLLGLDAAPDGQAMDGSGMDEMINRAVNRIIAERLRQREAEARGEVIALPAAPAEPVSEFEAIVERKLYEIADLRIRRLDRDAEERAQPEILDAELIHEGGDDGPDFRTG